MASLIRGTSKTGKTHAVEFPLPGRGRRRWRLGSVPKPVAAEAKRRVESILASVQLACPVRPEDEHWVRSLGPHHRASLVRTGLLDGTNLVAATRSLGDWVTEWLEAKTTTNAARTITIYRKSADLLIAALGAARPLSTITRDDAAAWEHDLRHRRGLAPATVRQHVRHVKACFNAAIHRDLITRNPFDRIASASIAAERTHYVAPDHAAAVLAGYVNPAHRLVFALARFAGVRVPSESHSIRWTDVDLAASRIRVYAPKTKQTRMVPISPALSPLLHSAFADASDPEGPVIEVSANNRDRELRRAVKRAGVDPWPRLWQTLRQSCETEWANEFPGHVVAAWAGHSEQVSARHYLMVTPEHFDQATTRSEMRSAHTVNEAESAGSRQNCRHPTVMHKSANGSNLQNSPARIRTGDRAIMSRQL